MKYKFYRYLLYYSVLCIISYEAHAVSVVYNFRIAQITKQPIFEESERNYSVIALAFDQHRKKYAGNIRQNFIGALSSFIYSPRPYYFRTDFAVSYINEKMKKITTFTDTETDDILFTLGKNIREDKRTPLTLSGLLGIPTHHIFRLRHIDFGYSQVGLGLQFDGLYQFNDTDAFIYGLRYIYFVPRKASDSSKKKYTFTIGYVCDVLLAYKSNWGNHGIEFGFSERFRFGANIYPSLDDITQKLDYIRNNFYAVYKYKFLIKKVHNRLLFNIAYGFDNIPKKFGNKYILFLWGSWNIGF